jgi:hypothetical protein
VCYWDNLEGRRRKNMHYCLQLSCGWQFQRTIYKFLQPGDAASYSKGLAD